MKKPRKILSDDDIWEQYKKDYSGFWYVDMEEFKERIQKTLHWNRYILWVSVQNLRNSILNIFHL